MGIRTISQSYKPVGKSLPKHRLLQIGMRVHILHGLTSLPTAVLSIRDEGRIKRISRVPQSGCYIHLGVALENAKMKIFISFADLGKLFFSETKKRSKQREVKH